MSPKDCLVPKMSDELRCDELTELAQATREEARRRVLDDCRRAPEDVAELLEEIARRLFDPGFDISALRRDYEPSAATLWRFRATLGVNPKVYLNLRRCEAAKRLLSLSDAPLAAIAVALGFPDAELFSKWFKGQTGKSPRQYREEARPAPAEPEPAWEKTIQKFRRLLLGDLDQREAACWSRHLTAGGDGDEA